MLRQHGLLTEQAGIDGLIQQFIYGARLGTNLVELGHVSLDDLGRMLALQLGVDQAGTSELRQASQRALMSLEPLFCLKHQVLPLEQEAGLLHLAMCDPRPEQVIEMAARLGRKIVPYVTPELRLHYFLEQYYQIARPTRFLRVPDGGETFRRRRHYLYPTIDPMMAAAPSGGDVPIICESGEEPGSEGEGEETAGMRLVPPDRRHGYAPPAADQREPLAAVSLREAVGQLRAAASSEAVLRWLVRPLYRQAAMSLLFSVRGPYAVCCASELPRAAPAHVSDPVISLEQPSLLELAYRMKDVFRTEGKDDTLQLQLADYFRLPAPGEVCAAPVLLFGRPVYILCLHSRPGMSFPPSATAELRWLSAQTTVALGRLCRRLVQDDDASGAQGC